MREGWRWFGPEEGVPLDEVRQAGATDIVSALHRAPIGAAWTDAAVAERKNIIETTPAGRVPLRWSVVESIPIPDVVKRRVNSIPGVTGTEVQIVWDPAWTPQRISPEGRSILGIESEEES